MQVIKKINNNVALCLDNNNRELVAFGKGIGFKPMPYELTDMNLIHRTYYGIDSSYIMLLDEIPEDIFEISSILVDLARAKVSCDFSNNLVFTLADHISFAIDRQKKHMYIKNQMVHDIEYFYENEMEIGELAIKLVRKNLKIRLPKEEAGNIALHIINAEAKLKNENSIDDEEAIIEDITCLIEDELNITINRKNFNYSRFVSHLQYLLKRTDDGISIESDNGKMFLDIKEKYPNIYKCVSKITEYIYEIKKWKATEEEELYLMLHVNRLYTREDCNQK